MPPSPIDKQTPGLVGGIERTSDAPKKTPILTGLVLKLFPGIRAKLIGIFVLIKVVPLVLLALFAWHAAKQLGENVTERSTDMADQMLGTVKTVGETVTQDATRALDERSSEQSSG